MSKKTKAIERKKKQDARRARKMVHKEKDKSLRAAKSAKRRLLQRHDHPDGKCGNPGCAQCHPDQVQWVPVSDR